MKVITLLNEKGGVGKTTLASHIAAGLAIRGNRVVLIDADAQGHSTLMLNQKKSAGLYDLLARDEPWANCAVNVHPKIWAGPVKALKGELMLVPSNVETRVIPMVVEDITQLAERLDEIRGRVDYVVIDTSPTPSLLHSMVYFCTDGIIMPSECESLSMDGLANTSHHMVRVNRQREMQGLTKAALLGVVPTMFEERTNAHSWGLARIREHFGKDLTWAPLPKRTVWRDAAASRQMMFAHDPKNEAANEMWRLVKLTEERIKHVG